MNRLTMRYRTAWTVLIVAAVVGLVALAPHLGFTSAAPAPIWSERPVSVTAAATVPAPNWVELTRALKPAVVNISTKRVEERDVDAEPVRQRRSVPAVLQAVRPAGRARRCAAWARASSSTRPATS